MLVEGNSFNAISWALGGGLESFNFILMKPNLSSMNVVFQHVIRSITDMADMLAKEGVIRIASGVSLFGCSVYIYDVGV